MIRHVSSFHDLLNVRFADGINAVCWQRTLPGDYAEVVRLLGPGTGIVALDEERLMSLEHGAGSREAVKHMLSDLKLLREAGRDPVLNIVYGYEKDPDPLPAPTDLSAIASATAEASANRGSFARDVFSWHVDSVQFESDLSAEALAKGDTWLCTYHGAPSEALDPDDAILKVSDPTIRAQLLDLFHQTHGIDPQVCSAISAEPPSGFRSQVSAFQEWLADNHYDLHYSARSGATPHSFGQFNLWRIACAWPGSPVPPCVHRAPDTDGPRLLLIS